MQPHQLKQIQPWGPVHGAKHFWKNGTNRATGQLFHPRLQGTTAPVSSDPALPPALFPYLPSSFKLSSWFVEGRKKSDLPVQNVQKRWKQKHGTKNLGKVWLAKQQFNRTTRFLWNNKKSKNSKLKLTTFLTLKPRRCFVSPKSGWYLYTGLHMRVGSIFQPICL